MELREALKQDRLIDIVTVGARTARRQIMSAPQTRWYREQGFTLHELVEHSPIVEVFFSGEYAYLNAQSRR